MSRATVGDEDSSSSFLWPSVAKRAIEGKRGQRLLRELEAALLSMPDKRLISGAFSFKGEVCGLGCLAVKRHQDKGLTREEALAKVAEEYCDTTWDEQFDHHEIGEALDITPTLAWEIMYENDDCFPHDATPEDRYKGVLRWVQNRIKVTK